MVYTTDENMDRFGKEPRIGFLPQSDYIPVEDACADWLARHDWVIVTDYRSPVAVAACRHAAPQIVMQRTDWKPQEKDTLNPVPVGRIWDERWDPRLQVVVTTSNRERKIRQMSTHLFTLQGPNIYLTDLRSGDVRFVKWKNSDTSMPLLLEGIKEEFERKVKAA